MKESKLRALAEDVLNHKAQNCKHPACHCDELPRKMAKFHKACSPQVVIDLLDELDGANAALDSAFGHYE